MYDNITRIYVRHINERDETGELVYYSNEVDENGQRVRVINPTQEDKDAGNVVLNSTLLDVVLINDTDGTYFEEKYDAPKHAAITKALLTRKANNGELSDEAYTLLNENKIQQAMSTIFDDYRERQEQSFINTFDDSEKELLDTILANYRPLDNQQDIDGAYKNEALKKSFETRRNLPRGVETVPAEQLDGAVSVAEVLNRQDNSGEVHGIVPIKKPAANDGSPILAPMVINNNNEESPVHGNGGVPTYIPTASDADDEFFPIDDITPASFSEDGMPIADDSFTSGASEVPRQSSGSGPSDDSNERAGEERDKKKWWRRIGAAFLTVIAALGIVDAINNFRVTKKFLDWISRPFGKQQSQDASDIGDVIASQELINMMRPGAQKEAFQAAHDFLEQTALSRSDLVTKNGNFYLPMDNGEYLEFTPKELIATTAVLRGYNATQLAQVYNGFNVSADYIHEGFNAFYLKLMTYGMNATEKLPMRVLYGDNVEGYNLYATGEDLLIQINKALAPYKNGQIDYVNGEWPDTFPNALKDKFLAHMMKLADIHEAVKGKNLEASAIMASAPMESYIFANRNIKEAMMFSSDVNDEYCNAKKGDSWYQVARLKCLQIIERDGTFATRLEVKESDALPHDVLQAVGYYNSWMTKLEKTLEESKNIEASAVKDLKAAVTAIGNPILTEFVKGLPDTGIAADKLNTLRKDSRTADIVNTYDIAMNADAEAKYYPKYLDSIAKMRIIYDIKDPEMNFGTVVIDGKTISLDATTNKIHELQNHRFRWMDKNLGGIGFFYGQNGYGTAPSLKPNLIGSTIVTVPGKPQTVESTNPADLGLTPEQVQELQKPERDRINQENQIADTIAGPVHQTGNTMYEDNTEIGYGHGSVTVTNTDEHGNVTNTDHKYPLANSHADAYLHGGNPDRIRDDFHDAIGHDDMSSGQQNANDSYLDDVFTAVDNYRPQHEANQQASLDNQVNVNTELNDDRLENNAANDAAQAAYDADLLAWQNNQISNPNDKTPPPNPDDYKNGQNNNNGGNNNGGSGNNGGNTENNGGSGNNGGNTENTGNGGNNNDGNTSNPDGSVPIETGDEEILVEPAAAASNVSPEVKVDDVELSASEKKDVVIEATKAVIEEVKATAAPEKEEAKEAPASEKKDEQNAEPKEDKAEAVETASADRGAYSKVA